MSIYIYRYIDLDRVELGCLWCFVQKLSKCLIIYIGDMSKSQFMKAIKIFTSCHILFYIFPCNCKTGLVCVHPFTRRDKR